MLVYEFLRLMRLVVLHARENCNKLKLLSRGSWEGRLFLQLPRRLTTSFIIKYCTVEPRYKEVVFHVFYYYWGKQHRSLYRELRNIDVRCS